MSHRLSITHPHELHMISGAAPMLEHMPEKERSILMQRVQIAAASVPSWPSYTGISKFVGSSASGKVTVYVDPSLGPGALKNAQYLLAHADDTVVKNDLIFGVPGGHVNVIIF